MSSKAAAAAAREASKPQWSTVLSDATMATVTLYACSQLRDSAAVSSMFGKTGAAIGQWQLLVAAALGLAGLAASAGTVRFAGVAAVRPLHDFLTRLSMFLTMPVLGLAVVVAYAGYPLSSTAGWLPLAALVCAWAAFSAFPRQLAALQQDYLMCVSLLGVLCIFFRACFMLVKSGESVSSASRWSGGYGLAGSLLVIAAAAAGSKGALHWSRANLRVQRVDVFHYLMAAANVCLVHFFQTLWA